jgi:hypothetical protein
MKISVWCVHLCLIVRGLIREAAYLVFIRPIDMPSVDGKWQQTCDTTSLYM